MADWFETRFREPVHAGQLDPAYVARVRALVVEEWQADAGSPPSGHTEADDHEGDIIMLETEDRPTGNQPASPHRRSPGRWLLAAAAVALVAVVAAVLAAGGNDSETEIDTVTSVPTPEVVLDIMSQADSEDGFLQPGRYTIDPDGDASTPLKVIYEVAAEDWSFWFGAMKFNDDGHIGLSITTVTNLTRDACHDHRPADPAVGPTVDDLATALTQLAPFEVTSPPSDVTMFGYPGKHLELTIPADQQFSGSGDNRRFSGCIEGELRSWFSPLVGGSFWGYNPEPGATEDFWILDVDGTRLVLETNSSPAAPPQDLAELEAVFDSIRIEP
jgi:hypothetical protein